MCPISLRGASHYNLSEALELDLEATVQGGNAPANRNLTIRSRKARPPRGVTKGDLRAWRSGLPKRNEANGLCTAIVLAGPDGPFLATRLCLSCSGGHVTLPLSGVAPKGPKAGALSGVRSKGLLGAAMALDSSLAASKRIGTPQRPSATARAWRERQARRASF